MAKLLLALAILTPAAGFVAPTVGQATGALHADAYAPGVSVKPARAPTHTSNPPRL